MNKFLSIREIEQLKSGVIIAKYKRTGIDVGGRDVWTETDRYQFFRLAPVIDNEHCKFWIRGYEIEAGGQKCEYETNITCECQLRGGTALRLALVVQAKCVYCGASVESYKDTGVCTECYRVQE